MLWVLHMKKHNKQTINKQRLTSIFVLLHPKKCQTSETNNQNMSTYLVVNLNQKNIHRFCGPPNNPTPRSVAPGQRSVGLCVLSSPSFTPQIFLEKDPYNPWNCYWLVVSNHLKNINQIGSFSPNRGENKKYFKPPPSVVFTYMTG